MKERKICLQKNAIYLNQICLNGESADSLLDSIYNVVTLILNSTKCPKERTTTTWQETAMNDCDRLFNTYNNMINNPSYNRDEILAAYNQYQIKRNSLHAEISQKVNNDYKSILESRDDKKLWALIDWSGNIRPSEPKTHPSIGEMTAHFQMLYEPLVDDGKLGNLTTNVYIPITDDQIQMDEVQKGCKQMKKGGFDFSITALYLIMSCISPVILHLLNLIFFTGFPLKLCTSLLTAIPKSGNYLLPTNFRGIQMQPLMANLYDRIITNRLLMWVKINQNKPPFRKEKEQRTKYFYYVMDYLYTWTKHSFSQCT